MLITFQNQSTDCPKGFAKHDGWCYRFNTHTKTWTDAANSCKSIGGFLAEPKSVTENQFIRDLLSQYHGGDVWLGATDIGGHQWQWMHSGDALSGFTDWAPGQPDNGISGSTTQGCLHMWAWLSHQWDDDTCSVAKQFVCQMPIPTI